MSENLITPFILCGGSGTRLWPLSRNSRPKQFLDLVGRQSLFQQTCLRLKHEMMEKPAILASSEHRFVIEEQMEQIGSTPSSVILEPVSRGTGPAALVAALVEAQKNPDQLLLLLPSDQLIEDNEAFFEAVKLAANSARRGKLAIFGIEPTRLETGYGYIETIGGISERTELYQNYSRSAQGVDRFVEKPCRKTAEAMLNKGNCFWNAGIFMFAARTLMQAYQRFDPQTLAACRAALAASSGKSGIVVRLPEYEYAQSQSLSLDRAILERADNIHVIPLSASWSDLGSWSSLWAALPKDDDDNVLKGDVFSLESRNILGISHNGPQLTLIGLEDLVAVATRDAVVIVPMTRTQDMNLAVQKLTEMGRREAVQHCRTYRPWGWFERLEQRQGFQVKSLNVKPGAKLSLQYHHHRVEHWFVVRGALEVTLGDDVRLLTENQSVYVPSGEKHRISNPGRIWATLIEIQSGSYLEEDDIVRCEDEYGRENSQ